VAEASARAKVDEVASRRELTKLLGHHDRVNARRLDYETRAGIERRIAGEIEA
jgi:hypothetical protein